MFAALRSFCWSLVASPQHLPRSWPEERKALASQGFGFGKPCHKVATMQACAKIPGARRTCSQLLWRNALTVACCFRQLQAAAEQNYMKANEQ